MSNLPPIHFPPPKNKKDKSTRAAYVAYINAHPVLKAHAQGILDAANHYGVDPVHYAALILFESGGKINAHSSANAWGLAQIHIPTWVGKADPRDGHIITNAEVHNPGWNLQFGAFLFGRAVRNNGGDYDAAYRKGYNPGYQGPGPFKNIPKNYVPTTTRQSPQTAAATSVETSNAKLNLTDPYVTINNKGKLVKTTQAGALKVFGQPVRRSQILSTVQNLNDLYLAYTGRAVTLRAVKDILGSGKSRYQIIDILSKGPHFVGSPVWKQNAPGYEAVWKSIYGQNSTPDANAVKYAIVNNLGGDGFASTLRSRPDYENSQEFKGNEATLSAVYTKVYGVPDPNGLGVVKQATKQGQSPDEFASWLRAQPEYQYSSEFKSRTLGVASALGFVTGQQATLGPDLKAGAPAVTPNPDAQPAGVLSGK